MSQRLTFTGSRKTSLHCEQLLAFTASNCLPSLNATAFLHWKATLSFLVSVPLFCNTECASVSSLSMLLLTNSKTIFNFVWGRALPGKQKLKIKMGHPENACHFWGKGANKRMINGLKTFKPRNEVPFATPKRTRRRNQRSSR